MVNAENVELLNRLVPKLGFEAAVICELYITHKTIFEHTKPSCQEQFAVEK